MRTVQWFVAAAVAAGLAGCGADEIASPGSGGGIVINYPPAVDPGPGPVDPGPGANLATPATGCPTITNPVALRDDGVITGPTGTYRVCALPARITASSSLERFPGLLYALDGRVDVGTDLGAVTGTGPTLTIAPGVVIYAKTGASWLAVNRGSSLSAVGTATRPIVFTSRDNVLGLATDASQGQWGGVVLLGRATITDCTVASAVIPPSVNCERQTEGAVDPAYYGGVTDDDNSGTMRYVQIRYSGYVFENNSELQSLTLSGVGSATQISHIQSHNSSDDGFENFGGTVDLRRFVITGADDDSVDVDTGYRGTIQHVIAVQKTTGSADSMIELDSGNTLENQQPRTHLKLANFTFVHRNVATGNGAAMLFRGQADATLVNGVVTSPIPCLRLSGANILVATPAVGKEGPPVFRSVVMQCGATRFSGVSGVSNAEVETAFAGPNNSAAFTATLTGGFINGTAETAVTAIDPKTIDSRFDTTTYVGAVRDATDTWYAGWTCNSATASFGTTSSSCTSLPSLLD